VCIDGLCPPGFDHIGSTAGPQDPVFTLTLLVVYSVALLLVSRRYSIVWYLPFVGLLLMLAIRDRTATANANVWVGVAIVPIIFWLVPRLQRVWRKRHGREGPDLVL
jgi:hypothetical protein